MSRAKTITLFTLIGPAVAAAPFVLTILTLAAFQRDAQGIGIAVAALFMAYAYGLIPSAVSGWMFSWVVGRHPHVINRNVSVAQVGAVAGFLSSLPLAAWAFLFTEKDLAHDHALMAGAFLVPGIVSGAVCAVLWRKVGLRCDEASPGSEDKEPTAPTSSSISTSSPTQSTRLW